MRKYRRILRLGLGLGLLLAALAVPARAAVDGDEAIRAKLLAAFRSRAETVRFTVRASEVEDEAAYQATCDRFLARYTEVLDAHPECFYVRSWFRTGLGRAPDPAEAVFAVLPLYDGDLSTAAAAKRFDEAVKQALDEALDGSGGAGMSDLQKALALHDYLALHCEYDYGVSHGGEGSAALHSAYGALVPDGEGRCRAVCEGYARAYIHLLGKVGVRAGTVVSDSMDHTWNWVELDGKRYHVDLTYDDRPYVGRDWPGRVLHEHFLRSDAGLSDHEDFDGLTDTDDRFERGGYVFEDAETAFFWNAGKGRFFYLEDGALHSAGALRGAPAEGREIAARYRGSVYRLGASEVTRFGMNTGRRETVGSYSPAHLSTYGLRTAGDAVKLLRLAEADPELVAVIPAVDDVPRRPGEFRISCTGTAPEDEKTRVQFGGDVEELALLEPVVLAARYEDGKMAEVQTGMLSADKPYLLLDREPKGAWRFFFVSREGWAPLSNGPAEYASS